MKKVIKNNLFGFLLGMLLCSGIVYATNIYKAVDISYKPIDSSWEISNVNEAINSLYDIITTDTTQIIFLGNALTYNIKELYPDIDYASLTNDNFIVGIKYISTTATSWSFSNGTSGAGTTSRSCTISSSYDKNTGILTISNTTPITIVTPNSSSAINSTTTVFAYLILT